METAAEIARMGDDELRERLRDVRAEEDSVSYERRMLHGRIDVVRGEIKERLRARAGEATDDAADGLERLLRNLKDVLAHVGPPPLEAELATFGQQLEGDDGDDDAASADELPDLASLGDDDLAGLVRALVRRERAVSDRRNELHVVIDQLRKEHVARLQRRYGDSAEGA